MSDVKFQYFPMRESGVHPPVTMSNSKTVYVDLETFAGNYGDALDTRCCNVRLISVHVEGEPDVYVFDMLKACPNSWKEMIIYLESFDNICMFNAIFDLSILVRHGMAYPKVVEDPMIASKILANGANFTHALATLLYRHLGITISKVEQVSDWSGNITPSQILYSATDTFYLPQLLKAIKDRLEVRKLTSIYNLEMGFLPALVSMNLNGIAIDKEEWLARADDAEKRLGGLAKEVLEMFPPPPDKPFKYLRIKKNGEPFAVDVRTNQKIALENEEKSWNLASPAQVIQMFEEVGVMLPNTSYEVLVEHKDDHESVAKFLEFRQVEKEATTFGKDWIKHLYPNGRVYPEWGQLGASSGRMTCSNPNLQQIPRGRCRKGITADEGCVLVRADFSQIEARVAAKISRDEVLMDLFQRGDDIHAYAAKAVLGKLSITPDERQIGKSLVFGLLFSMSAPSLRVYCKVNYGVSFTLQEAEVFRDRFFRTFPGLARWHDRVRRECNSANEFRTLVGRRRIVVHLQGTDTNMLGLGLNTPVQGTAADMLKVSVREIWARRQEMPAAKLLALIHDEIIMNVRIGYEDRAAQWMRGIMIECGNLIIDPVPCDASVKIGKTWGG